MKSINKVAIYARLSNEDGIDDVSHSIQNQIELAKDYCNKHQFVIAKIYQDDGFSGSSFNRPGFQSLIEDIKAKKINVVITKDLSRLGRNLLGSGYYIEEFFPLNDVRYISINDNYDSLTATTNDNVVLINFINDLYVKDCRKKTQQQLKRRSKQTIMSTGPYGYYRQDGKLFIDEEPAKIVREIFERYVSGEQVKSICEDLIKREVLCPAAYRNQKYNYSLVCNDIYGWKFYTILDIIHRTEYMGCAENLKLKKKRRNKDSITLESTHEPIVSKDLFLKAQEIARTRKKKTKTTDMDRLKGYYYLDNNVFRIFRSDHEILRFYYWEPISGTRVRVEYFHDATYDYCMAMFLKYKGKNTEFIEEFESEFSIELMLKKKKEIERDRGKVTAQYEKLLEKMFLGEISNIDFISKKDILLNKLNYYDEEFNNIVVDIEYQKKRLKYFREKLEILNSLDTDIDKLEFIRAVSTRCDVTKTESGFELNIKFIFEL